MSRSRWYAPLTALLGGLAAGVAHPPFGMILGLLGYSLILLRLETIQGPKPLRAAFGLGWLAGLGYFVRDDLAAWMNPPSAAGSKGKAEAPSAAEQADRRSP